MFPVDVIEEHLVVLYSCFVCPKSSIEQSLFRFGCPLSKACYGRQLCFCADRKDRAHGCEWTFRSLLLVPVNRVFMSHYMRSFQYLRWGLIIEGAWDKRNPIMVALLVILLAQHMFRHIYGSSSRSFDPLKWRLTNVIAPKFISNHGLSHSGHYSGMVFTLLLPHSFANNF